MKCLCIILFALLYLTAAYGESFSSPNSGLQCKPAKSHIFKFENTHKPFELSLITNQEELQKYKEEEENTPLEGYIEFTHKGVKTKASALIKQRGQSRRESCEFKPFEVSFTQKVEAFEELGKKFNVKNLRTPDWIEIDKAILYEQEQILLQEYYIYKIQNILNPISLATQLLKINYINFKALL
jgi:hypothetical protein